MIETKTLPLSKVKTVQDLKDAIGESQLVMYTKFDYYSILDARKAGTTWTKVYVIKIEKGEIKYYTPVTAELSFIGDKTKCVNESFQNLYSQWKTKDHVEKEFLELFLYNRKKKNTMYLTDTFIPADIKEKAIALWNESQNIFKEGLAIGNTGTDNTNRHRGVYKTVPQNEVVSRHGDYSGITYVVGGVRHVFNFNYSEAFEINDIDRYFNINGWARTSRTRDCTNSNFSFRKIPQKEVNKMHALFLEAIRVQGEFSKLISTWNKSNEVECK
jgi:hypothetical protein